MSIWRKALMIFVVLSALNIGVSTGVSSYLQDQIVSISKRIGGKQLPSTLVKSQIQAVVYHILFLIDQYASTPEPSLKKEIERTLSELSVFKTSHSLLHFDSNIAGPGFSETIDGDMERRVSHFIEQFSHSITGYLIAYDKGKDFEAELIRRGLLHLMEGFVRDIDPYIQHSIEDSLHEINKIYEIDRQAKEMLVISSLFIFVLSVVISLLISLYISRRLKKITQAAEQVSQGRFDVIVPESSTDEIGQLESAFNTMSTQLTIRQQENSALLEDLEDRVEQRTEDVVKATHVKDEFLASMSHELRTPLTSIIGNAEYLNEKLSLPDLKEIVHDIETAGLAQLALVNDILDMSKIESGKFTIEELPFDLDKLLHDIQGMLAIRAQDAGLELMVEQNNRETHLLVGDKYRIGQILINLLGNAIKFTEQGEICLTSSVQDGWLQFEVKDTGIGMTRDEQSRLFQKFEQADGSISRRFGGSGLGLYISLNLAQMMGGRITATSIKNAGSTFILAIPYRKSGIAIQETERQGHTESLFNQQFSGNVLVVEDTLALQLLERRMLEGMGVTVTIANNGQEAVELVASSPFDLILMDMQMPVMDGIEATQVMRADGVSTPICAVTANVMVKHRERFEQAGCDGFIAKPIDKSALKGVLSKYLGQDQDETHDLDQAIAKIRWSEEYSVGHPQMDQEHQEIVEGINVLVGYCLRESDAPQKEQVLVTLLDLQDLVIDHLAAEESLLEVSNYPERVKHFESHHDHWDHLSRAYNGKFGFHRIEAITRVLLRWWERHILVEDMAYKEHMLSWLESNTESLTEDSPTLQAEEEVDDELMAIFNESVKEYRQALLQALSRLDWGQIKEIAHPIKGSGTSFGYPGLTERARAVCDAYDKGVYERLPELTQDLLDELGHVLSQGAGLK